MMQETKNSRQAPHTPTTVAFNQTGQLVGGVYASAEELPQSPSTGFHAFYIDGTSLWFVAWTGMGYVQVQMS